jgi:hypothetical protein
LGDHCPAPHTLLLPPLSIWGNLSKVTYRRIFTSSIAYNALVSALFFIPPIISGFSKMLLTQKGKAL